MRNIIVSEQMFHFPTLRNYLKILIQPNQLKLQCAVRKLTFQDCHVTYRDVEITRGLALILLEYWIVNKIG